MDQLIAAHNSKKLHHANLIYGGVGEDPLPVALSLAAMLLCETETACGTCRNCKRVEKLEHPDLNFTFPFVSGGNSGTSESVHCGSGLGGLGWDRSRTGELRVFGPFRRTRNDTRRSADRGCPRSQLSNDSEGASQPICLRVALRIDRQCGAASSDCSVSRPCTTR